MNKKLKIIVACLVMAGLAYAFDLFGLRTKMLKRSPSSAHPHVRTSEQKIEYYTCSMHPQIHMDEPGNCPICGMTLVPVYAQEDTKGAGLVISPYQQHLVGLATETAALRQLTKKITTTGRVAFDPELATAIAEYLEFSKNVPSLKEAAAIRLKTMGLTQDEIKNLNEKTAAQYYQPQENIHWIYATIFENETSLIKPGTKALINFPWNQETWEGIVDGVDTRLDPQTRSAKVRIKISEGPALKPDTLVTVHFEILMGEKLAIPQTSIIDTGTRRIAFVMHQDNRVTPREIHTGLESNDFVEILHGLTEGEKVVSKASFLVDSETQLKGIMEVESIHQH
ncbi:MAG TPA: hypothetical protein DDW49_11595 [Deltaproteobacteria bacterium]|nr:hypothetical protein [Deltaproteobacteria bacterium]